MSIVGIDPGGTTGLCCIENFDVLRPYGAHHKYNDLEVDSWIVPASLVVMESVVTHGAMTQGKFEQIKVVGIVEHWCNMYNVELVWVSPEQRAVAERLFEFVKETRSFYELPRPHARDAYFTTVAYLLKEGMINPDGSASVTAKG